MFGLAYRMLGEAAEAEDVVQDAYLRWHARTTSSATPALDEDVLVPEAWLTKVVTNLCLNRLVSARVVRERYVGSWLPAPVFTATGELGPLETVEQRESLSVAVLTLLERLTPPERAAFVLREAFGHSHREIADILELDEANVRQLYRRARAHVGESRVRFAAEPAQHEQIVQRFISAAVDGDVDGLERLLAADVTSWSDGGGRVTAARRPVVGRAKVARLFLGLGRHPRAADARLDFATINAGPALVVYEAGRLTAVVTVDIADGLIVGIRTILNPDKLVFAAAQRA